MSVKHSSGLEKVHEPIDAVLSDNSVPPTKALPLNQSSAVLDPIADLSSTPEKADKSDPNKSLSALEKAAYVIAFAVLVVVRIPSILGAGRFWAEEGPIFFMNALSAPWYQALFFSYGGYLNITANLAGILAKYVVPLKWAPYVTSLFGLLVQCFPAVLLAFSPSAWLKQRKALLLSLLILGTLPASQEVWLSSIGSQVHLNLCVALIFVLEAGTGAYGIFQKVILVLAPLSGPGGSFLLPLFFARAFIDRSKPRLIQGLVLASASAIQLLFFYHAQVRTLGVSPILLVNLFFVKHLVVPFLGITHGHMLAAVVHDDLLQAHPSKKVFVLTISAFVGWAVILWREKKSEPFYFFVTGLILAGLAYFGALDKRSDLLFAQVGYRYSFAPQILFELSFISIACLSRRVIVRAASSALILWLLVIALKEFLVTPILFAQGPSWPTEVEKWQRDSSYVPKIWPDLWQIDLSHVDRPSALTVKRDAQ